MSALLIPIPKANLHNTAILASTDILATALAPLYGRECSIFRVMVAMDAGGIFRATVTKATVMVTVGFNTGVSLASNSVYTFDLLVHSGDTVNFQYSANATLLLLRVQEIGASI